MSSDTYPLGMGPNVNTMPVSVARRAYRQPGIDKNYNTIGGRLNRGPDRLADTSHEDGSEYLPSQSTDDLGRIRQTTPSQVQPNARRPSVGAGRHTQNIENSSSNPSSRRPSTKSVPSAAENSRPSPGSVRQKQPAADFKTDAVSPSLTESHRKVVPLPRSISDLTNGAEFSLQRSAENSVPTTTNQAPISNHIDQQATSRPQKGSTSKFQAAPKHSAPADCAPGSNTEQVGNDAWSPSPSVTNDKPSSVPISPAGLPHQSSTDSWSPTAEPLQSEIMPSLLTASPVTSPVNKVPNESFSPDSVQPSTPPVSSSCKATTPSRGSQPSVAGKFGLGELPIPAFSLESAGVMPTGGMDNSKLKTSERVEKVIKVGVPPTVETTCMKFAGSSPESNTQSTWSPPTVKTEKRQFNAVTNLNRDLSNYKAPIPETTTFMTEKDGVVEKEVKHTITFVGEEDVDYNQMLLDAIQTVTGLDKTLEVDKIEIKTEREYT